MSNQSNTAKVRLAGKSEEIREPANHAPTKPKQLFRQLRRINEMASIRMEIDGKEAAVKNWSRTGIGFAVPDAKSRYKIGDRIQNATIKCEDIVLYSGDIEIKTEFNEADGGIVYGAAFTSALLLVESVESAATVNEVSNHITAAVINVEHANPDFCQSILALRTSLNHIRAACEREEARYKKLPYDRRIEAEKIFLPNMARKVKEVLVHFNVKIAKQVDVESLKEGSLYHDLCYHEIYKPFFEGADFVRRAFEKPRGYAGDYEMMNQIYRGGYEGPDLFGKVLHNYAINEGSSESVRFRKDYFLAFYKKLLNREGKQKVLSVACGPAIEVQAAVQTWPHSDLDRIYVTLFDLDREALEHAQTKIYEAATASKKRPNVEFINATVKAFLTDSAQAADKYDLIYSGGLFDYLDNPTSGALVRKFAEMLTPGGTLVIGNFTKANTTKAFCHLVTHWHLIHKSEEEIKGWADGVKGCRVSIEFDDNRINAFLVLTRNDAC